MGKALIVSGGTAGSYTIKPLHNRDRLDAEIERIEASITDLEAAQLVFENALANAEQAVIQARDAVNAEIAAYIETGDNSALLAATENLARAAVFRRQAQSNLDLNTAQLATERLELERLQAVPQDTNQSAWCADFTENLSGEVGTAEIPGEGNTRIIIRPGYSGAATYSAARDGQLFHRAGMSPAQAYFNAAILPGWQKFNPTYRVGVLTAVDKDADTASVTLDAEESSAQGLLVNQSNTLTNIPVVYIDCNALPFEVGDRVVVEFLGQNWSSPQVIGFEANPKVCDQNWGDLVIAVQTYSPHYYEFQSRLCDSFRTDPDTGELIHQEDCISKYDLETGTDDNCYGPFVGNGRDPDEPTLDFHIWWCCPKTPDHDYAADLTQLELYSSIIGDSVHLALLAAGTDGYCDPSIVSDPLDCHTCFDWGPTDEMPSGKVPAWMPFYNSANQEPTAQEYIDAYEAARAAKVNPPGYPADAHFSTVRIVHYLKSDGLGTVPKSDLTTHFDGTGVALSYTNNTSFGYLSTMYNRISFLYGPP